MARKIRIPLRIKLVRKPICRPKRPVTIRVRPGVSKTIWI